MDNIFEDKKNEMEEVEVDASILLQLAELAPRFWSPEMTETQLLAEAKACGEALSRGSKDARIKAKMMLALDRLYLTKSGRPLDRVQVQPELAQFKEILRFLYIVSVT